MAPSRFRLALSGKRGTFRFTTLAEAEHTLQRVANMMVERERSELQRAHVQEERNACKSRGEPRENWPALPPLRGLSVIIGKAVINAINAFIISRRFQDEFVAKTKVAELEQQVLALVQQVEQYRQRVSELLARQQH